MLVLIIGVSGSGKTTIGRRLATELNIDFLDADDFHSEESRHKMSQGIALTDQDRTPWLACLSHKMLEYRDLQKSVVLACSALKKQYRQQLLANVNQHVMVYLQVDQAVLLQRLTLRKEHFAGPSLLASQLASFETPTSNEAYMINAEQPLDNVLADIIEYIDKGCEMNT